MHAHGVFVFESTGKVKLDIWLWIVAALAGATGGFMDALSGLGFGVFSATVLGASGVAPASAIAAVNLAKVGSAITSGASHWKFGNVRWRWVIPLAVAGMCGGVLGSLLLTKVAGNSASSLMPWLLLAMGLLVLRRFITMPGRPRPVAGGADASLAATAGVGRPRARGGVFRLRDWPLYGVGFIAGMVNALSGSYGPFATSAVLMAKRGQPRYTVGTVSVAEFFVAVAVSVTLLATMGQTEYGWKLPLALVAGALITGPAGAYLARRAPSKALGILVGLMVVGLNVWALVRVYGG